MSRAILCLVYSSLLGKSECVMMYTSVAGLSCLTTRCSLHTSTNPSALSFCHVFGHFSLVRAEGWSIWASTDAFAPAPGRRSAARGIAFCFVGSRDFREPLSRWRRLIRSFLDPWSKLDKNCPASSLHGEDPCQTLVADVDFQHELGKLE